MENAPAVKKRKLLLRDGNAFATGSEQVTLYSQDEMRIVPVLPDHVSAPVALVSVYAAPILDKKKTSVILRQLSDLHPLEGLSHIKRVRKQIVKDGNTVKDELQIILCNTSKVTLPYAGEISVSQILNDDISREFLGEPFLATIPRVAPQTRAQYEEASQHWPTAYHEDKELSTLISGEIFSASDKTKIQANILKALGKAEEAKFNGKVAVGALIVDPKSDTTLAMTSSSLTRGENPLQHAVMKCIDLVAHSQGGGAWAIDPESYCESVNGDYSTDDTPYLCTGYDLYVTQEPCIMCAMALVHSRIRRVLYITSQPGGALGTKYKLHTEPSLNHRYQVFRVELGNTNQHLDDR